MKTIDVVVTAEDIAEGKRRSCGHCPIAVALKRHPAGMEFVTVGMFNATVEIERKNHTLYFPPHAQDFIRNFDSGKPVYPSRFRFRVRGGSNG